MTRARPGKGTLTALGLATLLCGAGKPDALFRGRFGALGPNGLVTNEYAYWNPYASESVISPDWELTSGSLFSDGGAGWTGVPDDKKPDPKSARGNNSAVFRLTTKRADFGDVWVSFRLLNKGLSTTKSTPKQPYDGVHVFLRYQEQTHLYYASVNRREGDVVIKKKTPGGSTNGGTYREISPYVKYKVPYGKWQDVRAAIHDDGDAVVIELYAGDKLLVVARDSDDPIREPGKVGLRIDNADVRFKDFTVSAY